MSIEVLRTIDRVKREISSAETPKWASPSRLAAGTRQSHYSGQQFNLV